MSMNCQTNICKYMPGRERDLKTKKLFLDLFFVTERDKIVKKSYAVIKKSNSLTVFLMAH